MPGLLYLAAKRALDVAVAGGTLIATAPLLGAAALAVRLTMGGPVLFRQRRPGLRGRPFWLLKLRTMEHERQGDGPDADAARMTALGRLLRASSIDELPSLVNVLRGEMSLVGPRPLLMQYLDRYTAEQARRHEAKPGVTGWAQVEVRNAADWDAKLAYDIWYVDHRSFSLDALILWRTAGKVLRRSGISAPGHATMPEFQGSSREASSGARGPE